MYLLEKVCLIVNSQQLFQDLQNPIPDILRASRAAQIGGSQTVATRIFVIENFPYSFLDGFGSRFETEGIAQQHSGAENGPDRIGDALAGYVRSGTVYGLV